MESKDKLIAIIVISAIVGSVYSYSQFLTHDENIQKIKTQNENAKIIADLAKNKELQNACNAPKSTTLKTLKDDESVSFSNGGNSLTKNDLKNYDFKEIEDTTQTEDKEGAFSILGYEKTNDGRKKFKIILDNKNQWANADIIDVRARMALAKASIEEREVSLKLRVVKEYNKIKEVVILSVE
ncbi:hypothetical protein CBLAS_0906 [Campylobacter blaseri]|uniref:Uncharacterized protein n=1 Tax=Campylobacter blaseri TaxID=2042961 RepID=A0A2P8R2T8_9BACT|nr:hypothetical protein [Campylobacter blaseri]PSM52778.1 hypothetical protein CQ405_03375 [Campylobacter blaseri]PSM54426.1 hypothetical protein CRN67_03375 [Campylobacter blaseri]QKF86091.1 hypothetical protein CBLAS_0906 [Campylobacter blaseri]